MDPSARETYLDDACAGDPELRSHIARLLAVHQEAGSFLEHPLEVLSTPPDEASFFGTDRFRIVQRLGTGGMGVVYEAHDALRDEIVALKTLRRTGATDLYRLKREFRGLADVTHPNLVSLYELFVEEGQSFFTMELVRGVSFVDYVRGSDRAHLSTDRLVPALRQLIEGVMELHRRGKLHRDIKPSNVLVTPEGRVVILDFGLIADAAPSRIQEALGGGTPAYMSPEEVSGAVPSEASDWYSVGVTLYEALTGALPFDGSVSDVLRRKSASDPIAPADMADGVPAYLSALCVNLLTRVPDHRLTGAAALRASVRDTTRPSNQTPRQDTPFVGRLDQLRALNDAHEAVGSGQARTVAIYGPSGIGKSALVRKFLSPFDGQDDAVVLAGRCYENESVPYKALDGVVDELSRHLGAIPDERISGLLPSGESDLSALSALTRLFPVLLQVHAVANAARRVAPDVVVDPLRVRHRAIEALSAVLRRIAMRQPLVIWIDDLQWADADSAVLLDELLGPPNPPAMLTILSFRREETTAKPFLQALLHRADQVAWSALSLEPMIDAEAHALIEDLLPHNSTLTDHDKNRMAREAAGSPFVLEQLAVFAGIAQEEWSRSPTFARMFDSRLQALPQDARRFLETLALCGQPTAPEVVCDACEIARDRQSLIVMLRSSRFIRSSGSSARVETYHDRIREVLAGRIDPDDVIGIHGRMAAALVARQSDDYEALFEHYRGAGDAGRASTQAGLAAEKASAALAFDRAASFYRYALELAPSSSASPAWREQLADALANAGRPAEAAQAYLDAAAGAGHARQVELQRRAAEQFLTGGHIDTGLDLMRSVLESVGLSTAQSPRAAAVRLIWRRTQLRWRGLKFIPRRADEVDAEVLLRLDTCWATATGLALVDVISASDFIAQHLHLALDAGEHARIARGMALESSARSADWQFRKGAPRLAELSKALAQRVGTPQAAAMEFLADSVTACATGQWRRALSSSEQALTILRDRCVGVTWEMNIAQNMLIWALMYLGEFGEVSRRIPALLADARRRGNLYLATELCTRSNIVWLMADNPDEGERETAEVVARWSQKGFHRQHYSARLARVQTALYRGDPPTAWRLLTEQESKLRSSMLLHVQALRVESLYLRARCALAMACENPADRRFLTVARACARRIARERMPWSNPIGLLVEAGIASVKRSPAKAQAHLENAAEQFDRAEMKLYAAVTKLRLGALRHDDHGLGLQRQAEAWMAAEQIKNPLCLTRMLAPGFPDLD